MPALKPGTVIPTDEEDAVIAAALSDPDALPLAEAEWPILRVGRRLKAKVRIAHYLSRPRMLFGHWCQIRIGRDRLIN